MQTKTFATTSTHSVVNTINRELQERSAGVISNTILTSQNYFSENMIMYDRGDYCKCHICA